MKFLLRLLGRLGRRNTGFEISIWPNNKLKFKKVFVKRGVNND